MLHTLRSLGSTRSLAFKLTLAFLLVGLVGATLVPIVLTLMTQTRFEQFMRERDRSSFAAPLAEYYQATGTWVGVAVVFDNQAMGMGMGMAPPPRPGNRQRALILQDMDGTLIYSQGNPDEVERLRQDDQTLNVLIVVDGSAVGQLLIESQRPHPMPGSPEAEFLFGMTRVIALSALGATAVALVLGLLLARTLTRPIRELTTATQALARGELGQQVAVHVGDEIGQLAQAFNQMSADLATASQLRRQMTADIAHELRTPLSIILGYTESLSDGKLPAAQATFDIMHEEAQHLSRLIDDLRALSLAEAGELPLARQRIEPRALLERVQAAHMPEAQQHSITLEVKAGPDLPELYADAGRMAQVLGNLVSNALRYTPEHGRITLSATAERGSVYLRIQDNGAGIAPEDLPYVFNRFYRGDKSRHRRGGESGLGLAIAKSIVELHGGTIAVESTPGEGATFTVALPAA